MFRANPERVVRIAGIVHRGATACCMLVALRMHELGVPAHRLRLANACTSAAFVRVGPTVGAVAPYRMRAQAFALVPVFIFLMGGFFGGLIAGALSDAHGERTALTIVVPLAGSIGGLLFIYGSRFIKRDISLAVEELLEEQDEIERMSAQPDDIPVLQVRNLDFSYGPVQVLFDVELRRARRARCSRCSAPTAPASRRCCAPSAGSASPTAASCGSTAGRSPTSTPRSGSGTASCRCAAARACSPS